MAKNRQARLKASRRQRQRLLQELASLSLLISGSFFERFSTCSRPCCVCRKGKLHGPRSYVAVTRHRMQKQHYVPKRQVNAVREGIRQHHRLLEIVHRITAINLQLMRDGLLDEQER